MKKLLTTLIFLILAQPVSAWTFKSLMCDAECKNYAAEVCNHQVMLRTGKSTADKIQEDMYNKCLDKEMSDSENW